MGSRDRLVSAMAELLWDRGYAATSPRDVMTLAGVGQGSMYHHFSGKHQLAVEALTLAADALLEQSPPPSASESPVDRIAHHLQMPREGVRGCRIGRMTQDPQVVGDAELLAVIAGAFDAALERWRQSISDAVDAGQLPAGTVAVDLACTLSAVIQGGYVLARAANDQALMDAAVRGAVLLLDAARRAAHRERIPEGEPS